MDGFNTEGVRYNLTWQSMGDPFVELELTAENEASDEALCKEVTKVIKLAGSLGARVFASGDCSVKRTFCLEITFDNDESKRLFLGKLPTAQ